jgi:hypothetical protein
MSETVCVVAVWADAYLHFLTAVTADSARMGFPPSTFALSTVPWGVIVTSNRTVPPIWRILNTGG